MHCINGSGLHCGAQIGRNPLRRNYFQDLREDWPKQSEAQGKSSNQRPISDLAGTGESAWQPGTQKGLVGDECSPIPTLFHSTRERSCVPSPPTVVASKFSEPSIATDGTPPFVAVEKSGVMVHERMNSSERA